MTKDQITAVIALYDVKGKVIKEMSSSNDILYLATLANNDNQIAFQQGKQAAFALVMKIINKQAEDIKNQVSNEQHEKLKRDYGIQANSQ